MKKSLLLATACLTASNAFAQGTSQSAADVLIQSVQGLQPTPSTATGPGLPSSLENFSLTDPYRIALFTHWKTATGLSYDFQNWIQTVLRGQYEAAAHQWNAIQKQIPDSFQPGARTAYLYCLYQLRLAQTWTEEWFDQRSTSLKADHPLVVALDQTLGPQLGNWLMQNAVLLTPERAAQAGETSDALLISQNLRAYSRLRGGKDALSVLQTLPMGHPLRYPLALTVSLALAKEGKLGEAGSLLKSQLEAEVLREHQPQRAVQYTLLLARLLYQAQAYDAAETYYRKVPQGSSEFIQARSELAWTLLRKGKMGDLMGEIASLTTGLFDDQFVPESYLIRAVTHLKTCQYAAVATDFDQFVSRYQGWAKKIEAQIQSPTESPFRQDFFLNLAENATQQRSQEAANLRGLGQRSIEAVLPAVGIQKHWVDAQNRLEASLAYSEKQLQAERSRQWANRGSILREAIRKMRFVKIEAMSQMRSLVVQSPGAPSQDVLPTTQSAPLRESDYQFPFDGVLWPDELFRLQGIATQRCLKGSSS